MKSVLNFTLLTVMFCVGTVLLCAMESCENDVIDLAL